MQVEHVFLTLKQNHLDPFLKLKFLSCMLEPFPN
jgi:hypothetical protein